MKASNFIDHLRKTFAPTIDAPDPKRMARARAKAAEKAQRRGMALVVKAPSRRAGRVIPKGRIGHCLSFVVAQKNLARMDAERDRKAAWAFR